MKKKLLIALVSMAVISSSIMFGVYAASDIKLWINGQLVKTDVQIVNGSSYVPLRVVSEYLGAEVKWDGNARTINISSNSGSKSTSTPTSTPAPTPKPTTKPATTAENKIGKPETFNYNQNSANGITLTWLAKNLTNKTINYYTVKVSTYNPVGDPSYDEISGKSTFTTKYVGPVEPGGQLISFGIFTYQGALQTIVIDEIILEYSDKTKETIKYGYKTSDSSGVPF